MAESFESLSSNCLLIWLKWVANQGYAARRNSSHTKASRPAGEPRESAALVGGAFEGTAAAPLRTWDGGGPAGESREGVVLFGGGLGVPPPPPPPPPPIRSASRQGSGRTSGVGTGAPRRGVGHPYEYGTAAAMSVLAFQATVLIHVLAGEVEDMRWMVRRVA